ncbi:YIP1 family protein [Methanogenium sp. S4BF]|uniref:Yip1 family protein n=1 Tax=Methanogenium sp. S4BF TaxID=1789226 RepID=UPI002415B570|nr:Yip1 family protein [Methanogenium sp. S4BF]WFN33475.1 YIP1 family protein [Methanogenium sp. S4BF]
MIDTIMANVKGFLFNPVDTFQQTKGDEPKAVFTYFVVLLVIYSVLSAIIAAIGMDSMLAGALPGAGGIFGIFLASLIGTFILTLIFAAWLHLWVYLFGGRNGIMQTVKAVVYGSTPELLFGWIPFIGFLFSIWSLGLGILGIRELQELSTAKAVMVFVIAVVIPLIVLVLLAAFFFISVMTVTGTVPEPSENLFTAF